MYEIIMLLAFLYAATCQLLPRASRDGKPDLTREKHDAGTTYGPAQESASKQKMYYKKPVRCSDRTPVRYVQYDRLRPGAKKAHRIKLGRIDYVLETATE